MNQIYNMDCMEGMKHFPDKFFELAIVDPPYFSGPEKRHVQKAIKRIENFKSQLTLNFNQCNN